MKASLRVVRGKGIIVQENRFVAVAVNYASNDRFATTLRELPYPNPL